MSTPARIVKVLTICCLCNIASHAQPAGGVNSPDDDKGTAVAIELTKLEITDASLTMSYEIRNASDHEVWVCSEVKRGGAPFEMFLTQDRQTLLIRKRLDVPAFGIWRGPPEPGRYVRLSPGVVRPESLRIDLPATGRFSYARQTLEVFAETAKRLVLEIGYFDENLPALLRSIRAVCDQFSDAGWKLYTARLNPDMWQTYFRGLHAYRAALVFFDRNKEPDGEGSAYLDYSAQALTEKVLRMEINGVGIAYKGRIEVAPGD
jgi:hypothetical protein